MRIRRFAAALLMMGIISPAAAQSATGGTAPIIRSATTARDIGGFALGMSIAEVKKIVPITSLGNDNYQATRDGITYDFEVTCLGRVYRVASSQFLGHFEVDAAFRRSLASRLTAKYGPPSSMTADTFDWELIEPATRSTGQVLPFKTMWASAYVSSGIDGVTLEIKMLDFRIMWADEAAVNRAPRDKAIGAVTL